MTSDEEIAQLKCSLSNRCDEVDRCHKVILKFKEALTPFANYACGHPCGCHNCIAKKLIDQEGL